MGSTSLLIVGDDWRSQLEQYEDTETSQGAFRCFLGTCDTLLLKPGHSGWSIDCSGKTTVVNEGYAGSARLSSIDIDAMKKEIVLQSENWWDTAHNISNDESWTPFADIRKKYPKTPKYDKEIEGAAKLEWRSQAPLKALEQSGAFPVNYFYELQSFLDRLLLSRDAYVEYFLDKTPLISATDVIFDGKYLQNVDVNEMLARLGSKSLLTEAAVKI